MPAKIARPALFLLFTLLSFFAFSLPVRAQTAEEEKKAILALYQGDDIVSTNGGEKGIIRSAEQAKQSFKHYAKDYVCIFPDGKKQTAQDLQNQLTMMFRNGLQSFKADADITKFVFKDNTATVEMNGKATMELRRKDGITVPLITESKGRDFWVKEKGQWLIKRSRLLTNKGFAPDGTQVYQQ
ncbi:MAG: hypothetical protein H7Y38_20365 [Armatimonadetes bacterium]|nr:hypothetical protein [Armatimonadota bacterium]